MSADNFKKIISLKKHNEYANLENETIDFDFLTFNYKDNKSFCMAPWIHLYVKPDGEVPLCCNCVINDNTVFGNVNKDSLDTIWNSEKIKQTRLKMLKGEKIKECSSCYDREKISKKSSMRLNLFNNKYFIKYKNVVKSTKKDGEVEKTNIVYFDFRFSNKCNFSCRTCGPHYSSSWEKKINIKNDKINNKNELINKTKELILNDSLEEIYFAGGEPLIIDEHWEIINFLIEHKKFNTLIRYNTNLSVLNYKGNDFIEKLKLFKNVRISPSCDSLGIKGEYLRTGFLSKRFINNIHKLKENNFKYGITTVLSFFNIIYLYDFFNDLKNNDILYNNVNFIIITNVDDFNVYNLPPQVLKASIENINKLINSDFIDNDLKKYFKDLIINLEQNNKFDFKNFTITIEQIKFKDELNNLKFKDCLPELYDLTKDYFNYKRFNPRIFISPLKGL